MRRFSRDTKSSLVRTHQAIGHDHSGRSVGMLLSQSRAANVMSVGTIGHQVLSSGDPCRVIDESTVSGGAMRTMRVTKPAPRSSPTAAEWCE
jgi:hypothetical protein